MMKELDERKAIGPDGVSGYILKECRQKMVEPIHDTIECSIKKQEKSPKNEKELFTKMNTKKNHTIIDQCH